MSVDTINQFPRALKFILGNASGKALDFAKFRVTFRADRGDRQTPNTLDARIYNLADSTRNMIRNEFTQVQVQAGYPGNIGLIFKGTITLPRAGRENGTDNYIDITATDGDEAYNFAPLVASLRAGATPQNAVESFLSVMGGLGVDKGYCPNLPSNGLTRGKVFFGPVSKELRKFANAQGLKWSIQDGQLTFIPLNGYIPAGGLPILSQATGLLGVPEQSPNGIEVRTLLNPNYKIGQRVMLQSKDINLLRYGQDAGSIGSNYRLSKSVNTSADGTYYVMRAVHQGDTRGTAWWTDMTLLAVDATFVPESAAQSAVAVAIPPVRIQ